MARPLFNNKDMAIRELQAIMRRIEFIDNADSDSGAWSIVAVEALGGALVQHLTDAMEALTYLYCLNNADPEGTLPFIKLKDMFKEGHAYNIPLDVRIAANGIVKIKKDARKRVLKPFELHDFLKLAQIFISWMYSKLEGMPGEHISVCQKIRNKLGRYMETYRDIVEHGRYRTKRNINDYSMRMIYLSEEDEAKMTEEELDEFYKPRKANSQKSLAPLYIYKILEKHTNDENHFTQQQIIECLGSEYELVMDRKAVGRTLNTLGDTFPEIVISKGLGYWYSEKHVGAWDNDY